MRILELSPYSAITLRVLVRIHLDQAAVDDAPKLVRTIPRIAET